MCGKPSKHAASNFRIKNEVKFCERRSIIWKMLNLGGCIRKGSGGSIWEETVGFGVRQAQFPTPA